MGGWRTGTLRRSSISTIVAGSGMGLINLEQWKIALENSTIVATYVGGVVQRRDVRLGLAVGWVGDFSQ